MLAPAASKSASVIELPSPARALDEHLVAGAGELEHPGRGQRDPVLVVLDFAGDTDSHALMVKILHDVRQHIRR